jgi:hypothetical protein
MKIHDDKVEFSFLISRVEFLVTGLKLEILDDIVKNSFILPSD